MGSLVGQEVPVHIHTLRDVTGFLPGAQEVREAVMAAAVEGSTQRSAPAQSISSALTITANGSSIQENVGDLANLITGMFRDHVSVDKVVAKVVAKVVLKADHKVVARKVPKESNLAVAKEDPRWGRVSSPHFFSY